MVVQGYFDGNAVRILDSVEMKVNQKVQITILDEYVEENSSEENAELLAKYKGLGGKLWTEDAQSYVSRLRAEERTF